MAFESSLIGSDDFDPQSATEELLRRQMDSALPGTLEARDLNTRLLRKMGEAPTPRTISPGMMGPATPAAPAPQQQTPLDFSGFEPAPDATPDPATLDLSAFEPEKPLEPEKPKADPSKHWAVTRGFVSGLLKENPEGLAETLEGVGHLANKDFKESLHSASKNAHDFAKLSPEEYAKKSGSMWDIKSIEEALTWAGEQLGSGLASSVPSLVGGTAGAVVGGRIAGKPGGYGGAIVGATVPSAILNYGEVYKALKDEKVPPEDAAQYAAIATPFLTALDTVSIGPIISRLGGLKEVKAQAARAIAKRIVQEGLHGAGREGITEGLQDIVQSITVSTASDKPFWTLDTAKSAIENAVGGALTGGAMGGAGGIKPDKVAPAAATPPAPATPPPLPATAAPAAPTSGTPAAPVPAAPAPPPAGPATPPPPGAAPQADTSGQETTEPATVDETTNPAPPSVNDYATLREYGYSDEDIASMPPAQRAREVADAVDEGISPSEEMLAEAEAKFTQKPLNNEALADTVKQTIAQEAPETAGRMSEAGIAMPSTEGAGTRVDPVIAQTAEDVKAAQPVEPVSDAQAKAENYRHAHVGLPAIGLVGKNSISVETGAGQTRRGVGPDGKPWEVKLEHAYGRIKGTKGADGQPLDIVIGPNPQSQHVFVIDQHEPGKGFDEHKIMASFDTPQQAIVAYSGMYEDQGEGRIGHVTAFTPEQFEAWRQGDTTLPLGPKTPSAPNSAERVGADARTLTEADAGTDTSVPKETPTASGADAAGSADIIPQVAESSALKPTQELHKTVSGEVIPPGRMVAEPTQSHHDQIEAVLGDDYQRVAEVDIHRAAELMAENEGMSPETAFGQAVVENAVEQKFLTHQEAVQAYGEQVEAVLEPGREGTHQRGEDAGSESTASGEVVTSGTTETGVVSGSSEAVEQVSTAETIDAVVAADAQDAEQHDTERAKPDTERETGDKPADDTADTTKDADQPDAAVAETTGGGGKKKKAFVEKTKSVLDEEEGPAKVEAVGEYLHGARRDKWSKAGLGLDDLAGMDEKAREQNVTKHNIWPKPDYVAAVEQGVKPEAAALIKRIYDRMAVKMNNELWTVKGETAHQTFVKAVNAVREVLEQAKTIEDVKKASRTIADKLGNDSYSYLSSIRQKGSRSNPLTIHDHDVRAAEAAVRAGFPEAAPWTRLFEVKPAREWDQSKREYVPTGFKVYRKNGGQVGALYTSQEDAEAAAKAAYDKLGEDRKAGGEYPDRPHLDTVNRSGPDYRKGKDVSSQDFMDTFGFRGVDFGNWAANDERQKLVNLAFDALHDLARVLKIPAKAVSLNGSLGISFGSRGQGGRGAGAAHYEPGSGVINMTKMHGAGSLAHEWGHALDDYLGAPVGSMGISGGRVTPKDTHDHWSRSLYNGKNDFLYRKAELKPKLRQAANKLMHDIYNIVEDDEVAIARVEKELDDAMKSRNSWVSWGKNNPKSHKKAREAVEWWDRKISKIERMLNDSIHKRVEPTSYVKQAQAISGKGDYWVRPVELFARAWESFVFDKVKAEGFESQYLVHGVEENRFGPGFRGNPYPAGNERKTLNADFERLLKTLTIAEGKHGADTKIVEDEGEPAPIEIQEKVKRQPKVTVDPSKPKTMDEAFAGYFGANQGFENILAARRFAKDAGFEAEPKVIEEAIELAVVKVAMQIVSASVTPDETYKALVDLYGRQPRLGTRTSTSVRDQAYSTPVPLAYVASQLAGINPASRVLEPTAGNGALLIAATPRETFANEINPTRRANLKSLGFVTGENDATTIEPHAVYDVVIANPPFGSVKDEAGQTKVFNLKDELGVNYETSEIDHAIAIKALEGMKDHGRAVLILGGVTKMVNTPEGRADAYQGKAKREFFKALYDNYMVSDHFTVAGELYERQGAGWPVDVVVINGRGKSARPLPAVESPRIYRSWDALGGLVDGQQTASGTRPDQATTAGATGAADGLEGSGGGDRLGAGGDNAGVAKPDRVRQQSGGEATGPRAAGGGERSDTEGRGQDVKSGEPRNEPAAVDDLDALLNAALDDAFGAKETPTPKGTERSSERGGDKRPADTRPTSQVAKEAGKAAVDAADQAFSALYDLFGGNKVSEGFTFDEETYAKAKPHFEAAAKKFAEFASNTGELLKRMVAHLRDTMNFTREAMERILPYLKRFMQDRLEAAEPARKEAIKPEPTETENQVAYQAKSKAGSLGTLAPVNMAKPMSESLQALEDRVGPIDDFVAKELNYKPSELAKYFGAEQVDALGLAIDNIKRGKGFIIGDQTGIGKGRVNAAIIRWAIHNKRLPVFVTEKPGLYRDMFRDMMDIGMADFLGGEKPRILPTNADLKLSLEDGAGARLDTGDAKEHNKFLTAALNKPTSYDMVFSTYNQMQTQEGDETVRRSFLRQLAGRPNGIVVIFDESHNAGGQKERQKKKKADGSNAAGGRAEFARELIQNANGVFYSSATYAKRPDVMDLYAATDMAMAVDNISDLAEAISRGRVPMQQAVASMLAKAGQYMRRERSFAGISYNTTPVAVDRAVYNDISKTLAAVQDLSAPVKAATTRIDAQIRAEGEALGFDNATGDAGASSTAFTSSMHNAINQILLALKADKAADMAIEAIKRGEKPVLTVANTMEAFMKDYADNLGIKPDDKVSADFSDVLKKYLDRTRTILIKKPFKEKGDKPIRHYLTDEELGPIGLQVYDRALSIINGMNLSHLPISPIDHIKGRLKQAGYEMGEITGRTLGVDYTGETPVFTSRPGKERTTQGRTDTLKRFNTRPKRNGIHALIINQSGSTGLSAHASSTFDDQSKRRMMIVQAEGNIDTHMQLLGRINRTGQVVLPEYDQLVADIPAEKRPAANLAKKMASLNANTTASRGSAVTSKDVPDFLNEYGDEVAASWVRDNLEKHYQLASPISISEEGKVTKEDAMRKLTGRIPLLPIEEQEEMYRHLEEDYASLLAQLEAAGENALEAKSLDLKGRLLEYMEVQGKKNDSGSPFAAPVIMQKVSIARLGKPFKPVEIINKLREAVDPEGAEVAKFTEGTPIENLAKKLAAYSDPYSADGTKVRDMERKERTEALKRFADYTRPIIDEMETAEEQAKAKVKFDAVKDRFDQAHQIVPIGQRVVIKTDSGNLTGIVLGVKQHGSPKNPLALGSWRVTFAIADSSRTMTLPFHRIFPTGQANPESSLDVEIEPMTNYYERPEQTLDRFQHMQSEAREERWIGGGNILAAYDWLDRKGAIINYTSYKGTVHQGVLTARGFDPAKQSIAHGQAASDPAAIAAFLAERPGVKLWAKDEFVAIEKYGRYGEDYIVTTNKAKAKGGRYFLDKQLTDTIGEFSSRGGAMTAFMNGQNFNAGVRRLISIGAEFRLPSKAMETVKVKQKPESEPDTGHDGPALATVRPSYNVKLDPAKKQRLKQLVVASVEKMVGKNVGVAFVDEAFESPAQAAEHWGGAPDKAAAVYFPARALIVFALDSNLETNIPHEVYHAVEFQLQTPAERELMERETPRIREGIRQYAKEKFNLDDARIDALSGEEVRAIGMEAFMEGRLEKSHLGVRRWYQKLVEMLRDLGRKLRGMGIESAEDIYGKVAGGFYRDAQSITPRSEASALAAIRPGGARPGPQPQGETVSQKLMDHGHDLLAGLSNKLGIGKYKLGDFNATEARTLMQDKVIRVKRAEESVGGVPSNLSAYQAESLYHGRTGERLERLEKDRFEPMLEAMHAADISPGEMNEYLYARHAPERNAYIDTINPGLGGEGSGMSDAEAAAVMAGIPAAKLADYQAIADMVDRINADTRDTLVAYGLISQDTADSWANQYQNYVPLRGFAEGTEDENLIGKGSGYDTRGKESKPAFGRASEADGPLHYIIQQAQAAIVRGEKNRVGNTFLRFVRANPDPDRWQVNAPTIKRRIDARTGLVTSYADFNYHNDKDAFVTKVGGKPVVIRLYGKDGMNIARALKSMGASNMNGVLRILHNLTTLMSRLSTQWNPNFTIPNFARDLGEAFINLQAQDQAGFVTAFAKHLMPAMAGSFRAMTGAPAGNRYVDAFREFDRAGGRVHFFGLNDPDQIKNKIGATMRRLEGGGFNSIGNAVRALGRGIDVVNGSVENATRLAAYMAARDVGMSAPDAAMLARNLTVDFNKKGEWGQAANALFMFANASLQGTARMGRALTNKNVRRAVYTLAAMGAVGALYNISAGGDDDDGTPYYLKIKPYIRDKNLIIMWPKGMGMDGKYVKVPLPYGFAPFHVIGDRAAGFALGKDKLGASAHAILTSIAEAFNPTGEESSLWMQLVPSLMRPGLHIAMNKNWTGNPLYPEHDYDKTKPDSEKSFRSNSDFSKFAARKLNETFGGSRYAASWADVHPGSIDHVLETISGGLGKFVMDVARTGGAFMKGEPFDETEAPVIRRFLGSAKDPASDAQAYYETRDEARKGSGENLRAARKDLQSGTNKEQAESFIRDNPQGARGGEIFKAADEQMKPLRARRTRIEESTELSTEQKRRELDAVTEQMRQVQNTARKRYKDMKEGVP